MKGIVYYAVKSSDYCSHHGGSFIQGSNGHCSHNGGSFIQGSNYLACYQQNFDFLAILELSKLVWVDMVVNPKDWFSRAEAQDIHFCIGEKCCIHLDKQKL